MASPFYVFVYDCEASPVFAVDDKYVLMLELRGDFE